MIAKDDSSFSSDLKTSNNTVGPPTLSADFEPPTYAQAQAESSRQASEAEVLPQACNYMHMNNRSSIEGVWVLDTNKHVPDSLLPPIPLFEFPRVRPHLSLNTSAGSVNANVLLSTKITAEQEERALLKLFTQYGEITVHVNRLRSSQRFKLMARSACGNVFVLVPRDYAGPLKYKTGYGNIKFSDAIRTVLMEVSGESGFIGGLENSGFKDFKTWEGDEIEAKTSCGDIHFLYTDEEIPPTVYSSIASAINAFQESFTNTISWMSGRK